VVHVTFISIPVSTSVSVSVLFCLAFFLKAGSVEAYQESSTDDLDPYTRRVDVPLLWQG
jgi:hypothetical protein